MKVTGYRIQHALRELEASRELAHQQFTDNVMTFESQEDKLELPEVFARFTALERKVARLQIFQANYNLSVQVQVGGETMSLHEAVKLVGGAGRAEKMWRDVVKGNKANSRYNYGDNSRSKDQEYAKRSISVADALGHAKVAARTAAALRQAIQVGNATELDLEGLDNSLLES